MRRTLLFAVTLLLTGYCASPALSQDVIKLFKVISSKDEIVIGLTGDELRRFGPLPDLDNLARQLASAGEMTVWQYAVRKDANGTLQQAPLRRVAIFRSDTLRIEPYATPLPVMAPR